MKKSVLIFLLNLIAIVGYAQKVKLEVSNPAPRVGDEVSIKFKILSSDSIPELVFPISASDISKMSNSSIASGSFDLDGNMTEVGSTCFGPFTFVVNEKEYKSDILCLEIYPALPVEKNGFWTRLIEHGGEYYLITEQRVNAEWNREKSGNTLSMTLSNEGVDFAELKNSTFKNGLVEIDFSLSQSHSQRVGESVTFGDNSVNYKLTVYKVKLAEDYKSDLVLKKRDFKDFPKSLDFNPIEINFGEREE